MPIGATNARQKKARYETGPIVCDGHNHHDGINDRAAIEQATRRVFRLGELWVGFDAHFSFVHAHHLFLFRSTDAKHRFEDEPDKQ